MDDEIWAICSACGGPILIETGCIEYSMLTGTRATNWTHCETAVCRQYAVVRLDNICAQKYEAIRLKREQQLLDGRPSPSILATDTVKLRRRTRPSPPTWWERVVLWWTGRK